MNLPFQNATTGTSLIETIINNLCLQIIAFQQSIQARETGNNFPTLDETNQLVKLVNVLNKLYKQQATDAFEKQLKSFVRFVKKSDPEMAGVVDALFNEFSGGTYKQPQPEPGVNGVLNGPNAMGNVGAGIHAPLDAAQEAPPTEAEFHNYKHALNRNNLMADARATFLFRGREVNLNWLQYNLLQILLPPNARTFFMQECTYHQHFDHDKIRDVILEYLEKNEYELLG